MKIEALMQKSGVKFGTSGARGLVADLTDRVAYVYTLGFLAYLRGIETTPPQRVAVAGDLRSSTPRIKRAVLRAVEDAGLVPVDCGSIPTPAVSLYGFTHKIPSIMVTGSHIPDDRNGIKFNRPNGEILKEDEAAIREQEVAVPPGVFDDAGMLNGAYFPTKTVAGETDAKNLYIDRYVKTFPEQVLYGIRIGLYEHSAVGRDLLGGLLTRLGAKVSCLGRSETFVPVDTEAVRPEDIEQAKIWAAGDCAIAGQACDPANPPFDVIFSTDGDGDRPLLFDETGRLVRGDIAGVLCARFLEADCVVTPVSSSTVLERSAWFGRNRIIRTKIGSPYVVEAMNKAVAQGAERVVGYEANGGFFTATPIHIDESYPRSLAPLPTRDPVIVLLAVLQMSKKNDVPISMLLEHLPRRVVMSDRIGDFPSDLAKRKMDELLPGDAETIGPTFAAFGELTTCDTTDGLRMVFGDNADIVHVRPSGNAPEFRCYVEADTNRRAHWLLDKAMEIVSRWKEE